MPRSNWKGVISFGLVSIPISLYPVTNTQADISFHQIDKRDNARIKYQRINANTGQVVPWEQIARGYEYDKETTIAVPDDVLKKVAGDNARMVNIDTFIDKNELDYIMVTNCYYLVPAKGGDKGYVILRDALKETNKIGIAKVIISTREYLSAVVPDHDALLLYLLKYDAELVKPSELDLPHKVLSAYKINNKEMQMAKKLINSMSSKWHPEKYIDEYQTAIHKWVKETIDNLPHTMMKQKPQISKNIVNFVDLLQKSLASSSHTKKPTKHKAIHKLHKTSHIRHANRH